MSSPSKRWLKPGRVAVIASTTFTQLVRMKVFYFMAIFAVIVIASNFFDMPQNSAPEAVAENQLRMLKSASFGAMQLFAVVLAVVSTALLLPKDVEDRTLYTVLAKPVPRLDYLVGKLLGVIMLIAVSLFLMDLLMTGVLSFRTNIVLEEQLRIADLRGGGEEYKAVVRSDVLAQGPTWSLQGGVLSILLQASVLAAIALLISTFSSSTIFTTIISFLIYFIGHMQADARDFWFQGGEAGQGMLGKVGTLALAIVIPDFQLFNLVDATIQGEIVPLLVIAKLAGLTFLYLAVYTLLSWFIFSDKEF